MWPMRWPRIAAVWQGGFGLPLPKSVANVLLTPAVAAFRRSHPSVQVELLIADRFLDLHRGEADIAIRATTTGLEDSDLVGRCLAVAPWAVYCSRDYAEQAGMPADASELGAHAIVSGEGSISEVPALRWLERSAAGAHVAGRSNSLTNLHAAVRAGLGVSTLPCLLGGSDPLLVKCFLADGAENAQIWLVISPEVHGLPHIRAFSAALAAHFKDNRALICGED